ncbi:hypothetical protein [Allosphingosinicella deserti]|uniref:Uncharacterized protein n=1 Tax=Allosphingosinicella deserti TaxID=2116704 RepID=A0A2P7QEA0_9SPHN|nr:hypothetical protein [Sphingomonas deserti]PSJ36256.1 hypothetical protein C7I55_27100 [Sphingomonas deserti]
MMRWLGALGWFKWPSLILVASPIAAYPFWLRDTTPAEACGFVAFEGGLFRAHRRADGAFVLRPAMRAEEPPIALAAPEPIGFDSGGMIVKPGSISPDKLGCPSSESNEQPVTG